MIHQQRIQVRFSKRGTLKFIGHNDMLRAFESLFRRAKLPIAVSGGFHPKVKMSFPSALALGFEGLDEVCEITMAESAPPLSAEEVLADLNRNSVPGLTFLSARILGENEKKARLVSSVFQAVIPEALRQQTAVQIKNFLAETTVIVSKTKGRHVDVRKSVADLTFSESTGALSAELLTQAGPEAGIKEVLTVLGLEAELFITIFPARIKCRLAAG